MRFLQAVVLLVICQARSTAIEPAPVPRGDALPAPTESIEGGAVDCHPFVAGGLPESELLFEIEPRWYGFDSLIFGEPMAAGFGGPDAGVRGVYSVEDAEDTIAGFQSLRIGTFPAAAAVSPLGLMPIPYDPNDPVMRPATGRAGLGNGYALFRSQAVVRFTANVKMDLTYDTGAFSGAGANPALVALDGSDAARGRGIFDMALRKAELKSDVQLPSDSLWAQGYYDFAFTDDEVEVRQLYARVENLMAGKSWSTFSDQWALPQTIVSDGAPAGAVYKPAQVQLHYAWAMPSGLRIGTAIERAAIDDFTAPVGATRLRRYPDFIARVRYQPGDWQGVQFATLVRRMGFEDAAGVEEFATGWGLTGALNTYTSGANNIRIGCSVGEGLGSYLFGLADAGAAAFFNGAELQALRNVGCFASYQHYWTDSLWMNFAYGFAETEARPGVADAARSSQNAWVNCIYDVLPGKAAFAIEYQYGVREVASGVEGDNHHIHVALQIGVGYKPDASGGRPTQAELTAGRAAGPGFVDERQTAPPSRGYAPSSTPRSFIRM